MIWCPHCGGDSPDPTAGETTVWCRQCQAVLTRCHHCGNWTLTRKTVCVHCEKPRYISASCQIPSPTPLPEKARQPEPYYVPTLCTRRAPAGGPSPTTTSRGFDLNVALALGFFIFAMGFLCVSVWRNRDLWRRSGSYSPGDKAGAYVMSQSFVERKLRSPSSADFPWYDPSFVTDLGGGRFRVSAYVDAQNAFGAQVRTHYTCVLETRDGNTWHLVSLSFY